MFGRTCRMPRRGGNSNNRGSCDQNASLAQRPGLSLSLAPQRFPGRKKGSTNTCEGDKRTCDNVLGFAATLSPVFRRGFIAVKRIYIVNVSAACKRPLGLHWIQRLGSIA